MTVDSGNEKLKKMLVSSPNVFVWVNFYNYKEYNRIITQKGKPKHKLPVVVV